MVDVCAYTQKALKRDLSSDIFPFLCSLIICRDGSKWICKSIQDEQLHNANIFYQET